MRSVSSALSLAIRARPATASPILVDAKPMAASIVSTSTASQMVQAEAAARMERRCQNWTPTLGSTTASRSTARPIAASSSAASAVWPNEAAKRAFMTRPTAVSPSAVRNSTPAMMTATIERGGFGGAEWLAAAMLKACPTSCAAASCDVRVGARMTLPLLPANCVMRPASAQEASRRRNRASDQPNCWARSPRLISTRPSR